MRPIAKKSTVHVVLHFILSMILCALSILLIYEYATAGKDVDERRMSLLYLTVCFSVGLFLMDFSFAVLLSMEGGVPIEADEKGFHLSLLGRKRKFIPFECVTKIEETGSLFSLFALKRDGNIILYTKEEKYVVRAVHRTSETRDMMNALLENAKSEDENELPQ